MMCTMCDPEFYAGDYYVKNCTDQTFTLRYPCLSPYSPNRTITPGDSINVGGVSVQSKGKPYFDLWIQGEVARNGENISLEIRSTEPFEESSENSVLLKKWNYLDRSLPGRQFFSESFWRHYSTFIDEGGFVTITDVWVFEILPEDIALTDRGFFIP